MSSGSRKRSPAWELFTQDPATKKAKCMKCGKQYKQPATETLRYHLLHAHFITVPKEKSTTKRGRDNDHDEEEDPDNPAPQGDNGNRAEQVRFELRIISRYGVLEIRWSVIHSRGIHAFTYRLHHPFILVMIMTRSFSVFLFPLQRALPVRSLHLSLCLSRLPTAPWAKNREEFHGYRENLYRYLKLSTDLGRKNQDP